MTDTYNDSTGSRKKFLIPLVVLLLCAVSLTGAGYAYNSSVENTGTANAGSDVLIMTTDKTGATEKTDALGLAAGKFYVSTATVISPTASVVATVEGTATVTVFFKLVNNDGKSSTYSLDATCTLAEGGVVTVASAKAGNNTVTLEASDAIVVVAAGESEATITSLDAGTTYKATFTISVKSIDKDVGFGNATATDDAAAVVTALKEAVYTVALDATIA